MQEICEEIIREVDNRTSAINPCGKEVIKECKKIIVFLHTKLAELKTCVQSTPFRNESEEICFFKHTKPMVLGRLIYFHELLRIESQRPLDEDGLDEYYEKQQEEQKLFFDRHVAFYQYYKCGGTYLDSNYFLCGRQEVSFDVDVCHLDYDSKFTTGYDHLVARIVAMEMLYAYLTTQKRMLIHGKSDEDVSAELLKANGSYKWSGSAIELVEMVYGWDEVGCINGGEEPIHELVAFMGTLFGVDIRDCYSAYTDMKRRKNESRTYFLDKMRERLNKRMERDDDKEGKRK